MRIWIILIKVSILPDCRQQTKSLAVSLCDFGLVQRLHIGGDFMLSYNFPQVLWESDIANCSPFSADLRTSYIHVLTILA